MMPENVLQLVQFLVVVLCTSLAVPAGTWEMSRFGQFSYQQRCSGLCPPTHDSPTMPLHQVRGLFLKINSSSESHPDTTIATGGTIQFKLGDHETRFTTLWDPPSHHIILDENHGRFLNDPALYKPRTGTKESASSQKLGSVGGPRQFEKLRQARGNKRTPLCQQNKVITRLPARNRCNYWPCYNSIEKNDVSLQKLPRTNHTSPVTAKRDACAWKTSKSTKDCALLPDAQAQRHSNLVRELDAPITLTKDYIIQYSNNTDENGMAVPYQWILKETLPQLKHSCTNHQTCTPATLPSHSLCPDAKPFSLMIEESALHTSSVEVPELCQQSFATEQIRSNKIPLLPSMLIAKAYVMHTVYLRIDFTYRSSDPQLLLYLRILSYQAPTSATAFSSLASVHSTHKRFPAFAITPLTLPSLPVSTLVRERDTQVIQLLAIRTWSTAAIVHAAILCMQFTNQGPPTRSCVRKHARRIGLRTSTCNSRNRQRFTTKLLSMAAPKVTTPLVTMQVCLALLTAFSLPLDTTESCYRLLTVIPVNMMFYIAIKGLLYPHNTACGLRDMVLAYNLLPAAYHASHFFLFTAYITCTTNQGQSNLMRNRSKEHTAMIVYAWALLCLCSYLTQRMCQHAKLKADRVTAEPPPRCIYIHWCILRRRRPCNHNLPSWPRHLLIPNPQTAKTSTESKASYQAPVHTPQPREYVSEAATPPHQPKAKISCMKDKATDYSPCSSCKTKQGYRNNQRTTPAMSRARHRYAWMYHQKKAKPRTSAQLLLAISTFTPKIVAIEYSYTQALYWAGIKQWDESISSTTPVVVHTRYDLCIPTSNRKLSVKLEGYNHPRFRKGTEYTFSEGEGDRIDNSRVSLNTSTSTGRQTNGGGYQTKVIRHKTSEGTTRPLQTLRRQVHTSAAPLTPSTPENPQEASQHVQQPQRAVGWQTRQTTCLQQDGPLTHPSSKISSTFLPTMPRYKQGKLATIIRNIPLLQCSDAFKKVHSIVEKGTSHYLWIPHAVPRLISAQRLPSRSQTNHRCRSADLRSYSTDVGRATIDVGKDASLQRLALGAAAKPASELDIAVRRAAGEKPIQRIRTANPTHRFSRLGASFKNMDLERTFFHSNQHYNVTGVRPIATHCSRKMLYFSASRQQRALAFSQADFTKQMSLGEPSTVMLKECISVKSMPCHVIDEEVWLMDSLLMSTNGFGKATWTISHCLQVDQQPASWALQISCLAGMITKQAPWGTSAAAGRLTCSGIACTTDSGPFASREAAGTAIATALQEACPMATEISSYQQMVREHKPRNSPVLHSYVVRLDIEPTSAVPSVMAAIVEGACADVPVYDTNWQLITGQPYFSITPPTINPDVRKDHQLSAAVTCTRFAETGESVDESMEPTKIMATLHEIMSEYIGHIPDNQLLDEPSRLLEIVSVDYVRGGSNLFQLTLADADAVPIIKEAGTTVVELAPSGREAAAAGCRLVIHVPAEVQQEMNNSVFLSLNQLSSNKSELPYQLAYILGYSSISCHSAWQNMSLSPHKPDCSSLKTCRAHLTCPAEAILRCQSLTLLRQRWSLGTADSGPAPMHMLTPDAYKFCTKAQSSSSRHDTWHQVIPEILQLSCNIDSKCQWQNAHRNLLACKSSPMVIEATNLDQIIANADACQPDWPYIDLQNVNIEHAQCSYTNVILLRAFSSRCNCKSDTSSLVTTISLSPVSKGNNNDHDVHMHMHMHMHDDEFNTQMSAHPSSNKLQLEYEMFDAYDKGDSRKRHMMCGGRAAEVSSSTHTHMHTLDLATQVNPSNRRTVIDVEADCMDLDFAPQPQTFPHADFPVCWGTDLIQQCLSKLQTQCYSHVLDVDLQKDWSCIAECNLRDELEMFDPSWHGPQSDQSLALHTHYLRYALRGTLQGYAESNPVFIYGDNIHWRVIGLSTLHKVIYLMDPYGAGGFPRHIVAMLQKFTDTWHMTNQGSAWTIEELAIDLQYRGLDATTCGPWSIWLTHQWLKYHASANRSGEPFSTFFARDCLRISRPIEDTGRLLHEKYINFMSGMQVDLDLPMQSMRRQKSLQPFVKRRQLRACEVDAQIKQFERNLRASKPPQSLQSPSQQQESIAAKRGSNNPTVKQSQQSSTCEAKGSHRHRSCKKPQLPLAAAKPMTAKGTHGTKCQLTSKASQPPTTLTVMQVAESASPNQRARDTPSMHAAQISHAITQAPQPMKSKQTSITTFLNTARQATTKRKADDASQTTCNEVNAPPATPKATPCRVLKPHKGPQCDEIKKNTHVDTTMSGNANLPFRILTWNVMGLTTTAEELKSILQAQEPDVVILSETKLLMETHQRTWIKSAFLGQYMLFCSSIPAMDTKLYKSHPGKAFEQANRAGSGGVIMAIHQRWANGSQIRRHVYQDSNGHLVGIDLQPPNMAPLRLIGVYMPHDHVKREVLYRQVQSKLTKEVLTILGGDWNAALLRGDRHTQSQHLTTADAHHQEFIKGAHLCHLPWDQSLPHRRHTFHPHSLQLTSSRIDDILLSQQLHALAGEEIHIQVTNDSDHSPVLATLELGSIGIIAPPPRPLRPKQARLKTPVGKASLNNFREQLSMDAAREIYDFNIAIQETYMQARNLAANITDAEAKIEELKRHQIDQAVQAHAQTLHCLMMDKVTNCAHHTLEFTTPTQAMQHKHLSRKLNRKLKRSEQQICTLKDAIQELSDARQNGHNETKPEVKLTNARNIIQEYNKDHSTQLPCPPWHGDLEHIRKGQKQADWRDWRRKADTMLNQLGRRRREIRNEVRADNIQHARITFQNKFATNQKAANKIINGSANTAEITALKDGSGKVNQSPEQVQRLTYEYFQKQAEPLQGKTGFYKNINASSFPWTEENHDGYKLETKVGQSGYGQINILDLVMDPARFSRHVSRLSNNKAPGMDGIANELLKNLPEELLQAIHTLYILMYMTAVTPQHFKESNTILLYKKDDPLMLENYRPICLANTIAKLWTSLLADCIATYADHFDILSYSQEGFRSRRNTVRQLQLVQNIITDAKLTQQDLYVMYVDFSSAFNTIDHDKLLIIMNHLGFPDDCIHVIRDLYTNAHTCFLVAGGETPPVKIDRGTLQGDSLSPLLFIIFMEPLLRWLQSGGRGYQFGSIEQEKSTSGARFSVGSNAYADDLLSATHTYVDMKQQAQKVDRFAAWGGLKANAKKSGVSAILHGTAQAKRTNPLSQDVINTSKRQLADIQLGGETLPFLHPENDPYRYLGVMLTLTLNWRVQIQTLLSQIDQKGEKVLSSLCSAPQKIQYIQSSIRPYVSYSFPLAIYSLEDIRRLDAKMVKIAKKAYGLNGAAPNNLILEEKEKMGLGLTSLMVDYAQLNGAYLTRALNDDGPLGWSTKALLKFQHNIMMGMPILSRGERHPHREAHTKDLNILKKICILREANIKLTSQTSDLEQYLDLKENELVELMCDARYDPLCLGMKSEIPPKVYMPLFQLGISSISQVMAPSKDHGRMRMLPASALHKLFPHHNIRAKHKKALNCLTLILNGVDFAYDPVKEARSEDLTLQQRTIKNPTALERIRRMTAHAAMPHLQQLNQRSVAAFPMHEAADFEADSGEFRDRSGILIDITHHGGKRLKQETEASKTYERREALPEFEQIVTMLLERDSKETTEPSRKSRKTGRKGKRKRKTDLPLTSALEDLLASIPRQDSIEAYIQYLRTDCRMAEMVLLSYDDFFQIEAILKERFVDGEQQFLVQWEPHPIKSVDAALLADSKVRYKCSELQPLPPDSPFRQQGLDSMAFWEDSWEPAENICDHERGAARLQDFKDRRASVNAIPLKTKRKDACLSNLERQGYWPDLSQRRINPVHTNPELKDFISIEPYNSINPDKDIHAAGQFCVHASASNSCMAEVFAPNGKLVGSVTIDRLKILHQAFMKAAGSNPGQAPNPSEESFAEAIAQLVTRYKDGHSMGACNTRLKNHWATPDGYMKALIDGLSLDTERFASPLNFTPAMKQYFSLYPQDQVFGANTNAFCCAWNGASQANPEYEHNDMDKAVRWAIASAQKSDEATLTAFVLPWWEDSAYFKWMGNPFVYSLIRINKKHFKFKRTNYTTTGVKYAGNPKWDINIFMVANVAGINQYYKHEQFRSALGLACKEFTGPCPNIRPIQQRADNMLPMYAPKALQKVFDQGISHASHTWRAANQGLGALELMLTPTTDLHKWDAQTLWYTDGSALETEQGHRIGAGVVCASAQTAKTVQCCGVGPTNTITRAELCALYQCLKEMNMEQDGVIATDSKAIMHMINSDIWSTTANVENKHKTLLQHVTDIIMLRASNGVHTKIVKVRSHSGIKGNDAADKLAREAAVDPKETDPIVTIGYAFDGLFWPGEVKKDREGGIHLWLVPNLNTGLKNAARPHLQTGMTNITQYVHIWERARETLHLKVSNAFWTSSAVSAAALKQTLRVRFGVLHNMAQAYKMHRPYLPSLPIARTKQCPLCGEEDSATHILNACKHPELKALHIERHNAAGRLILKQILQGAKGNQWNVFADIGGPDKMVGLKVTDFRVPVDILSDQALAASGHDVAIRKKLRPDILLVDKVQLHGKRKYAGAAKSTTRRRAHILEIGYTSESRYKDKVSEKQNQHEQLCSALGHDGYDVEQHNIILGSSGGIFKDSTAELITLGIDKDCCNKLTRRLHIHSIHWLHTIIKKRRLLEHGKLFGSRRVKKPPDR